MSQPPPPFPPRFAGPPQLCSFPPTGPPPPPPPPSAPFRGGPPPPFAPAPFLPFTASGGGPPACPPFAPAAPRWQPERPPPQWRPEPPPPGPGPELRPEAPAQQRAPRGDEDEDDERWLSRFLSRHRPPVPGAAGTVSGRRRRRLLSPDQAGRVAAEALRLVAPLARQCAAWRGGEAGGEEAAEARLAQLRELVRPLRAAKGPEESPGCVLAGAGRSRKKRLRRRQEARAAREEEEARRAERESRIDRWRARRAQEVEERRREQELKAAADSVLSEVRKKQADTKRMAEILRGLEKLRKLRKEAAGRKGVFPPPAADEAFENEIQSLRILIKKRTELYEAEERALRVMLEGEQEEERKRETEKKQKKEKEKLLQQKREMDAKLFGDPEEFPLNHFLEPFRQYYLQAEYSAPALIQIRHEWDQYLVPADHPEGSFIPPGWVLPSLPSSDIWATAVG